MAIMLPIPGVLITVLLLLATALALLHQQQRPAVPAGCYSPRLAWLKAGIYFCACLIAATLSGVLPQVLAEPLATAAQLTDTSWWLLTAAATAVIVIGYGVIWPKGTFTDGRKLHPLLAPGYGLVWGLCQGLLFLTLWTLIASTGLGQPSVAVLSYLAIGGYNGVWHRFYWDIQVSPPHNYTEWNTRKVLLCHTPNLLVCLSHLSLHGNAGLFVLWQGIALALSARAMHFPAYGDDYRAEAGRERSRS